MKGIALIFAALACAASAWAAETTPPPLIVAGFSKIEHRGSGEWSAGGSRIVLRGDTVTVRGSEWVFRVSAWVKKDGSCRIEKAGNGRWIVKSKDVPDREIVASGDTVRLVSNSGAVLELYRASADGTLTRMQSSTPERSGIDAYVRDLGRMKR